MSDRKIDHTVVVNRVSAASDIHDIRTLTTTGKIASPPRRPLTRTSDGRSDE